MRESLAEIKGATASHARRGVRRDIAAGTGYFGLVDHEPPPLAAIVHAPCDHVDEMLVALVRRLRAVGLRLGGLVQHNVEKDGVACAEMVTEDLATGRLVPISLQRGPGARGCRLDAAGLAEAAALAAAGIRGRPDLVIMNKFGRQEAEGRGLRPEMALAIEHDLPLLTTVSHALVPAWSDFAGPDWTALRPDLADIEGWRSAVARAPAPELSA